MAQEESPREDLLREATALVERIEFTPRATGGKSPSDDCTTPAVVAGFRSNGALSIFLSDDEVYHFNASGELRRAYLEGHLYKAVKGELVALTRVRTTQQVELQSRRLPVGEQTAFIGRLQLQLAALATDLAAERFEIRGKIPADADVLDRLRNWLTSHTALSIAARPNAD